MSPAGVDPPRRVRLHKGSDAAAQLPAPYAMSEDELALARELLRRGNLRVFRPAETALAGDFVVIDMSVPTGHLGQSHRKRHRRRVVSLDLKEGGGAQGNQLARVAEAYEQLDLDPRRHEFFTGPTSPDAIRALFGLSP